MRLRRRRRVARVPAGQVEATPCCIQPSSTRTVKVSNVRASGFLPQTLRNAQIAKWVGRTQKPFAWFPHGLHTTPFINDESRRPVRVDTWMLRLSSIKSSKIERNILACLREVHACSMKASLYGRRKPQPGPFDLHLAPWNHRTPALGQPPRRRAARHLSARAAGTFCGSASDCRGRCKCHVYRPRTRQTAHRRNGIVQPDIRS